MQLKRPSAIAWQELGKVESPGMARRWLESTMNLEGRGPDWVGGLSDALLDDFTAPGHGLTEAHYLALLDKVERGEILLVHGLGSEPDLPLFYRDEAGEWRPRSLSHPAQQLDTGNLLKEAEKTREIRQPIKETLPEKPEHAASQAPAKKKSGGWFGVDVLGVRHPAIELEGVLCAMDSTSRVELRRSNSQWVEVPDSDRTTLAKSLPFSDPRLMLKYGGYRIPVGFEPIPSLEEEPTGHVGHTILAPLLLRRFSTTERVLSEGEALAPGYYVYLFLDGHLWRELKAVEDATGTNPKEGERGRQPIKFQEIDLEKSYGKDSRDETAKTLSHVTVPVKIADRIPKVEIALAPVQWSWDRIVAFGGMHEEDPRRGEDTHGEVEQVSEEKRAARLTTLELDKLEHKHWPAPWCTPDIFPEREDLARFQNIPLPVFHLDDPVGMALRFKDEHAATLLETELLSTAMQEGEYPLALLIKDIVKGCQERLGAASSQGEDFEQLIEYEIVNSVDHGKLQGSIDRWQDVDRELSEALYHDGKRLLEYMTDDSLPVQFHAVMEDFFHYGSPEAFAQGSALWCSMIEGLYFEEAREYLKDVAEGGFIIGNYLIRPTEAQAKYLIELEKDPSLDDALYPPVEFTGRDTLAVARTSTKIFRYMVNGFALAQLDKPGTAGLKWLIDFVQLYVPEFRANVKEVALSQLYRSENLGEWHRYRYRPNLQAKVGADGKNPRVVPRIVPEGIDLPRSAAEIKSHPIYKQGLVGLWGTLEMINLAVAYGKAFETWDSRDMAKLGIAAVDTTGFLASVVDMATDKQQKLVPQKKKQVEDILERATQRAARVNAVGGQANISRISRLQQLLNRLSKVSTRLQFAGDVSRLLGLVAAAATTAIAAWDIAKHSREGNGLGVLGGSLNFAGGLGSFVGSVQFNRWSKAQKAMQAARTTRAAGAAATATVAGAPEGLALILVSSLALLAGEFVLKYALTPDLLKAIKYGWFGTEPYARGITPYERPPVAEVIDHSRYEEGLFGQRYTYNPVLQVVFEKPEDFDAELSEIYRCLFEFQSAVAIYREVDFSGGQHTGREVVKGSVFFSRFAGNKSLLDAELELTYGNGVTKRVGMPELLLREEVEGESLRAVHVYYPVTEPDLETVVLRASLDALGDGRFTVPAGSGSKEARFTPVRGAMGTQYRYGMPDGSERFYSSYQNLRADEIAEARPLNVLHSSPQTEKINEEVS